jgi:AcrR family transcriptional regulator
LGQFEHRFKILNTRSKKLRADDRRLSILAGASNAIRRLGLRAGMRQIAEACGVTPGNLYYYFRDKNELIYFCQDVTLDALLQRVAESASMGRHHEQLRWLISEHLRILLDERVPGAAHLEVDGLPAPLYRKLVAKRDRYERAVRDLIAEGQLAGEFRAGDAKLATFALLGALNWTARWFRPGGGYDVTTIARQYADQLVGGLLSDSAKRKK